MKSLKTLSEIQINPRLVAALGIERNGDDKSSAPLSSLPSAYAEIVHRKRREIPNDYPENEHRLTCRACGKQNHYDLGLVMVHQELLQRKSLFVAAGQEPDGLSQVSQYIGDYIQFTGYFRCKHCNGGDDFAFGDEFTLFLMAALVLFKEEDDDDSLVVQFGELQSFDGYAPRSGTASENHLLDLIMQTPDDAFLWNRLGNVYRLGGVPELAIVAFEQSIRIGSTQVESQASLAFILYQIGELEACIRHSHLALVHARFYTKLESAKLRDMVCLLLRNLLDATTALDDTDLFIPPYRMMEAAAALHGKPVTESTESRTLDFRSFDLFLDDVNSFANLANIYVGSRGRKQKQGSRIHKKHKKRRR